MGIKIDFELADTPPSREFGLQFVKEMSETSGMLFKFQRKQVLNFWMKNCYLPLDIAFIDDNKVVKTTQMVPLSLSTVSSDIPCGMALEVPAGSLEKANGKEGSIVNIDWELKRITFEDDVD